MDSSQQNFNQNMYNDAHFFGEASSYDAQGYGPSSGLTPYLNGGTNDANVFENEYSMHGQFTGNPFHGYDVSMNGMSHGGSNGDSDGMTFNPQMMMSGNKQRESSNVSSTDSTLAPGSPPSSSVVQSKQLLIHTLPRSSNSSDSARNHSSSPTEQHDESLNSAKRNKFLERNRLAAAKCRTKKKEWTNNLEAAARQASQQTRELHAIVQNLRNEVQEHKELLKSHQGCDCHPIHEYLLHHADR